MFPIVIWFTVTSHQFLINFIFLVRQQMQKYEILGLIGEGAYGVVLKCKCNDNKDVVAIKKFKQTEDDEMVKVLKMLRHTNIVQLKEAFRKKGVVYLVFEYVPNNMLQVLQKTPEGLEPETIRLLIYQLLKGLAYMHSLNVVHRDIKPENLLVGNRKEMKICDFGFARQLKKQNQEDLTDYVATRWYRPPELLVGARYGKEIDIWAVGCIFGELIDGNPMFPGENELDQLFLIQKCLGPLTPDHFETFLKNPRFLGMKFPEIHTLETLDKRYLGKLSPKAMHFLKQMLKMNPSDRLTAVDALKHPYFDGIRQEDLIRKLSSNNYVKNESKVLPGRQEYPHSVNQDRKKYQTNPYNPPVHSNNFQRERTEQSYADHIFSKKSANLQANKKFKQAVPISKHLTTSKGFNQNIHSKSVNKSKINKLKDKHISLQKHQHCEIITKTQAGFYIMGGGGIIHQRHEEDETSQYTRNKIYNVRSPKSKQQKSRTNMASTEEVQDQQEAAWQSTRQFPLLMMASHKSNEQKKSSNSPAMNIIITNSTFNYKNH